MYRASRSKRQRKYKYIDNSEIHRREISGKTNYKETIITKYINYET